MGGISLMPDIRRVFQYHGAEHKAISTYEAGEPLTVENARRQPRFHPRCGTSFLLIVILVSVLLFALTLHRPLSSVALVDHLVKMLIKLPLMLPIAGHRLRAHQARGRRPRHPLVRLLIAARPVAAAAHHARARRRPARDRAHGGAPDRRAGRGARRRSPPSAIEVLQSFDGPVAATRLGRKA